MYNNILLAVALQQWERYSVHALAARDLAAALVSQARRLCVLSVYEHAVGRLPNSGLAVEMAAKLREQYMEQTDRLMAEKMQELCCTSREPISACFDDASPRQPATHHRRGRV